MPNFEQYDLSSLRVCTIWGTRVPPSLLNLWKKITPDIIYLNGYGQTETCGMGALNRGIEFEKNPESVGKTMTGMLIKILSHDGEEVPAGEVGEIVMRGKSIMTCYYKDEEKTTYTQRGGWHHTGDLGKFDEEGRLYFVDRLKDMIKTGGENVSSADVETVLSEHPMISEAAVIGINDEIWGEAVTAFVKTLPGSITNEKEIVEWSKEQMAAYKVPKKIFFVDDLPRNPSGKILKKELRNQYS